MTLTSRASVAGVAGLVKGIGLVRERGDLRRADPAVNANLTSEKGVRLAQNMQVCPCIPVGIQL
jgi:hypothetical protein